MAYRFMFHTKPLKNMAAAKAKVEDFFKQHGVTCTPDGKFKGGGFEGSFKAEPDNRIAITLTDKPFGYLEALITAAVDRFLKNETV